MGCVMGDCSGLCKLHSFVGQFLGAKLKRGWSSAVLVVLNLNLEYQKPIMLDKMVNQNLDVVS